MLSYFHFFFIPSLFSIRPSLKQQPQASNFPFAFTTFQPTNLPTAISYSFLPSTYIFFLAFQLHSSIRRSFRKRPQELKCPSLPSLPFLLTYLLIYFYIKFLYMFYEFFPFQSSPAPSLTRPTTTSTLVSLFTLTFFSYIPTYLPLFQVPIFNTFSHPLHSCSVTHSTKDHKHFSLFLLTFLPSYLPTYLPPYQVTLYLTLFFLPLVSCIRQSLDKRPQAPYFPSLASFTIHLPTYLPKFHQSLGSPFSPHSFTSFTSIPFFPNHLPPFYRCFVSSFYFSFLTFFSSFLLCISNLIIYPSASSP